MLWRWRVVMYRKENLKSTIFINNSNNNYDAYNQITWEMYISRTKIYSEAEKKCQGNQKETEVRASEKEIE